MNLPNTLKQLAIYITMVGSRVTCNPAPTDTDCDWLILVNSIDFSQFIRGLTNDGWVLGGSNTGDKNQEFFSFTKGEDNIVLTDRLEFYGRFITATQISTKLNLLVKQDRINLFQGVLYGNINQ